jgi:hypothetical protein
MTNPIKKFFQLLKSIILFPISFLQARKAYQDMNKIRRLSMDPKQRQKLLTEMGLDDEMMAFFNPFMQGHPRNQKLEEVDLTYLDEEEDEEEAKSLDD